MTLKSCHNRFEASTIAEEIQIKIMRVIEQWM